MASLTTEQLARMSRLLDEVVDAGAAERERWLQALPPEHHDLAPALREALACAAEGAGWLESLPRLGPYGTDLQAGDAVGPYRLVRRLGAGGMAEVWLAQRADGAFRREVALKTPATVQAREDLARRFANERDILAALEHPRIARFYDAGTSADGRPYLALEHVPGRSLLEWADERRLGVRQRVALFLQVVEAVAYAHARGVLHRDLKPSNVLVSDAGQVHLLDFGVARLIEPGGEAEDLTGAYGAALTPAYASPEQLRRARLDASSDVYSLGVMLHELLAGWHPHARPGAHADAHAHARAHAQEDSHAQACPQPPAATPSAEAPAPSSTVSAAAAERRGIGVAALRRALAGDLDAIVRKAMATSPAQRYASAAELGSDLQRHLASMPVQALPHGLPYRARKFLRRHRSGVAQAALGALAVGGLGSALLLMGPWSPAGDPSGAPAASAVAAASGAHDGGAEARRAEADALLAQGDVYANGPFERDAQRAEVAYRKAAALRPEDALPWARLAQLHLGRAAASPAGREARHALAREAIETALRTDADSLPAHAARFRHAVEVAHRWDEARSALDRMRVIDPADAAWLPACEARFASVLGRLDEAVRIQRRVVEHDPHDAAALAALAGYLFRSDRLDEALLLYARTLQINPHAAGAHATAGVALALQGRDETALAAVSKEADPTWRLWSQAIVSALLGRREASQAALAELLLHPKGNAYAIAQVYAVQGRRQAAFEWLQRACVERQGGCEDLRSDRFLRALRDDARHRALLVRMGLDTEPVTAPDADAPARPRPLRPT